MRHNRQPILMSMFGKVTVVVHVQVLVRSSLLYLSLSIDRSIDRAYPRSEGHVGSTAVGCRDARAHVRDRADAHRDGSHHHARVIVDARLDG